MSRNWSCLFAILSLKVKQTEPLKNGAAHAKEQHDVNTSEIYLENFPINWNAFPSANLLFRISQLLHGPLLDK